MLALPPAYFCVTGRFVAAIPANRSAASDYYQRTAFAVFAQREKASQITFRVSPFIASTCGARNPSFTPLLPQVGRKCPAPENGSCSASPHWLPMPRRARRTVQCDNGRRKMLRPLHPLTSAGRAKVSRSFSRVAATRTPLLPSYCSEDRSVRFTVTTHARELVVDSIPALA